MKPKLLEDLGRVHPNEKCSGKRHYGIFECPICKKPYRTAFQHVESESSTKCKSCNAVTIKTTHGMRHTRIYEIWKDMVRRCGPNPKRKTYTEYYARGITICEEWKADFDTFHRWSLDNGYEDSLSIDRIKNDGNYEPLNCRWTTKKVQNRNTRLLNSANKSGYRGVHFAVKRKKYVMQISVNKKVIYIGAFNDKLEAAKAYDQYVIDHGLEHTQNGVLS